MSTKAELWEEIGIFCAELKIKPEVRPGDRKDLLEAELVRVRDVKFQRAVVKARNEEVQVREERYMKLIETDLDFFSARLAVPEQTKYHDMLRRVTEDLVYRTTGLFRSAAAFAYFARGAGDLIKLIGAYESGEDVDQKVLLRMVCLFLERIVVYGHRAEKILPPDPFVFNETKRAQDEWNAAFSKEQDNGSKDNNPSGD